MLGKFLKRLAGARERRPGQLTRETLYRALVTARAADAAEVAVVPFTFLSSELPWVRGAAIFAHLDTIKEETHGSQMTVTLCGPPAAFETFVASYKQTSK